MTPGRCPRTREVTFAGGVIARWRLVVCLVVECLTLGLCLAAAEGASAQPPLPTGQLSAVSCKSGSGCVSVGSFTNKSGTTRALVEVSHGAIWSIQSTPNPSGSTASVLSAVSCVSTTACVAVGYFTDSNTGPRTPPTAGWKTFALRWNGNRWRIQSNPNPAGARNSSLSAVSCPSRKVCIAVGSFTNSAGHLVALVEQWNGSRWWFQQVPAAARGSALSAVSCTSPTVCTAVGGGILTVVLAHGGRLVESGGALRVERWNGVRWSVQRTPDTGEGSGLGGVSCTSATACTAIGSSDRGMLAERWNGTRWSIKPTPNPGSLSNQLGGVSCTSATACTAVGAFVVDSNDDTAPVVERSNGNRWSIQPTPGPDFGSLFGVSCTSARSCTAVGSNANVNTGRSLTLAEHWNGSRWSNQSTPNPS